MLGEFFRTAREYAQVITSGSLTKVDRLKLTLHSVNELELNLAALGQEKQVVAGFQLYMPEVKRFVGQMAAKLTEMQKGRAVSIQNKITAAIAKTEEIFVGIPSDDIEQFRKKMRAKANKLAANQSELLSLLAELKEILPAGEANMNSRDATPLDAQQSYDQGSKVQARCIQYTSITLQQLPDQWSR